MTTALQPYREEFVLLDEDDPDSQWGFVCNTCRRSVNEQPCPQHAPRDVPGLQRAECTATPPHPPYWTLASDGYPAGCPTCQYLIARDEHAGCAHSGHRAWRRWRASYRLLGLLSRARIVTAYGATYDGHCHGCISGIRTRWSR